MDTVCPPKGHKPRDSIGTVPQIETPESGFVEVLRIAHDNRHHVLMDEECNWLKLKLKVIAIVADRGLAILKGTATP